VVVVKLELEYEEWDLDVNPGGGGITTGDAKPGGGGIGEFPIGEPKAAGGGDGSRVAS
jgi:hypothetical protein